MTDLGRRLRELPLWLLVVVTLVGLPAAGLVGMVASDMIPDHVVMERLFDATETRAWTTDNYPPGLAGGRFDRYSECKRVTIGLGDPAGVGAVESAIRAPTLGPCSTAVLKVTGWAHGEGLEQAYEYSRYWNGSVVVLRPLVALFGVAGTRVVMAAALLALGYVAWRGIVGRVGLAAGVVGTTLLVGSTDLIDLPGALLHAVAWSVILGSVALIVRLRADLPGPWLAWVMFVVGAVFLYFGDMASPDAAWTLAVGAIGLGMMRTSTWFAILGKMALGGTAWMVGFIWMWVSKWVLGVFVYGYGDMRRNVSGAIENRLDGEHEGLDLTFANSLGRVWDDWWRVPLTPWVVAGVVIACVVLTVRRGRTEFAATWGVRLTVSSVVLIPLVWYAALRNHTQVHSFFVYRSLVAAAAVVATAWAADRCEVRRPRSDPGIDGVDQGTQLGVAALVEAEGDPG